MLRLLPVLALLLCCPCSATTVYKSVDVRGRVPFSDSPPQQAVRVETLTVNVQSAGSPELYLQRMALMTQVTDKIAAARVQREQLRLTARQQRSVFGPGEYTVQQEAYSGASAGTGYYTGGRRPHHRPPYYPLHPGVRPPHPPLRGPALVNQYPAALVRRSYSPRVAAVFQNSPVQRAWPR